MSDHVLLNLLNELGKSDKMREVSFHSNPFVNCYVCHENEINMFKLNEKK